MADEYSLSFSRNARQILERRYLLKDVNGQIRETPRSLLKRVAHAVAAAETLYGQNAEETAADYFQAMATLKFLPNSPTLMNAGTDINQLSACFVLPIADSIESIFSSLKNMALIHQSGGGTGFSFSNLRPEGDIVRTTAGVASGPVSFMRIFDTATEVIKQGGRRRGANMGILRVDHPDILKFISSKEKDGYLTNFNISVALTDDFMQRALAGEEYDLVNPRTGKAVKRFNAGKVFELLVAAACQEGDPGIVFIDRINEANPTPGLGDIESTNPCGEQPLLPNESCNLGSLNLVKFINNGEVEWEELEKSTRLAVRFLNNVIDVNKFPLPEIAKSTKANRKIGLGVMGFAEFLILLGIPYDSDQALEMGEQVMRFISNAAIAESKKLAGERGPFPNFPGSRWEQKGYRIMRNATLTTVAPTGTISIIASTSSGIEPLFAISYSRDVMDGTHLPEVNSLFAQTARENGFYSDKLMREIAISGSIREIAEIPTPVR
ncbi:MAG TPA: adenosylcobalamin-dependent ribonucleoside-diphosphate reductase, partial [Actinobacteria bacterium]|nr:adenosylcobalamin-dependent ribonucleoside-diphosphate reductase [Actinomycetes bacterium]HEX21503.1 adenosylcobalamin-dependent ribonucleoside-diphosphate reductase [Actinomycetota bacterium]